MGHAKNLAAGLSRMIFLLRHQKTKYLRTFVKTEQIT